MKHKILIRVLSIFMALSLVVPAFAAPVAEVVSAGADRSTVEDSPDNFYDTLRDAMSAARQNDTVYLLDNHTIELTEVETTGVTFDKEGITLDLDGNELTVTGAGSIVIGVTDVGMSDTELKNGKITVVASGENTVFAAGAMLQGSALNNVEIETKFDNAGVAAGIIAIGEATLTDCDVNAGKSDAFLSMTQDGYNDVPGKVTVNSGSYTGNITEDSYTMGGDNAKKNDDFSSKGTLVVTNDNTAAVVKGEDGTVRTYSDLNKAVEKSGDQPVTVLKADEVANLDIKADTTLNLVAGKDVEGLDKAIEDALAASKDSAAYVKGEDGKYHTFGNLTDAVKNSNGAKVVVTDADALKSLKVEAGNKLNLVNAKGESLNDKVDLGDKLVMDKDGNVTVKPADPVIRPVDPGVFEPIGPAEVEIDDPDTPLAGLPILLEPTDKLTRGMLMSILHMMDSAPAAKLASFIDVAADSDYAEAIGWAEANGIATGVGGNKFAPEGFVTRGQLVTFLNRYAAYVGSDVTAKLDGDANEVLTWAVAEPIINDFFARLNA